MSKKINVEFPSVLAAVMTMHAMKREAENALECATAAERNNRHDAVAIMKERAARAYSIRDAIRAGLDAWKKA